MYSIPIKTTNESWNQSVVLPYGLEVAHIKKGMEDWIEFLNFINSGLESTYSFVLEDFMLNAGFSSMVSEFMCSTLPKHCCNIVKNDYPNGHPDILPRGEYPKDSVLHGDKGIEVKASRNQSGWQGHNPEHSHLLIFCFNCGSAKSKKPFEFTKVLYGHLENQHWNFSGRNNGSRRTATASINSSGRAILEANWVYKI